MLNINKRSNKFLRTWHYGIGAAFAGIFIVLAGSGLAINHAHDFALDTKPVKATWLNRYYGLQSSDQLKAYHSAAVWFSQSGKNLFINEQSLGPCQGSLVGATVVEGLAYLLCERELIIATEKGEVIETLSGFEESFDRLGKTQTQLLARGAQSQSIYQFNDDFAQWQKQSSTTKPEFIQARELPASLADSLAAQTPSSLTWERVMLDLHSGRIFGRIGIWLIDLAAIALLFSSVSGLWLWMKKKRR